jgi:hypothetical protein
MVFSPGRFSILVRTTVVAASLMLAGCVGLVPSFSNKPLSGKQIAPHDANFIVPGRTTRAEVIRVLGPGYRESERAAALGYGWEMPVGQYYYFFAIMGPMAGAVAGNDWEVGRWCGLFMTFDARGVVTRKEFVKLKRKRTLDEQLEKWAGWVPPNVPAVVMGDGR